MTSKQERVEDAQKAIRHAMSLAVAADQHARQFEEYSAADVPLRRWPRREVVYITRSPGNSSGNRGNESFSAILLSQKGWALRERNRRYDVRSLQVRVFPNTDTVLVTVEKNLDGQERETQKITFGDESPRQEGFVTIGEVTELLERRAKGRSLGTRLRRTLNFVQGKTI